MRIHCNNIMLNCTMCIIVYIAYHSLYTQTHTHTHTHTHMYTYGTRLKLFSPFCVIKCLLARECDVEIACGNKLTCAVERK